MGKPHAPRAPDPYQTAGADYAYNNPSQYTPYGSLVNTPPQFGPNGQVQQGATSRMNLSPEIQHLLDQQLRVSGGTLSEALRRLPELSQMGNLPNFSRDEYQQQLFDRQRGLLDPVFAEQERGMRDRLSNQGLAPGSEAYGYDQGQFMDERNQQYGRAAMDSSLRAGDLMGQDISNTAAQRAIPFNEIASLLGLQQVQMPQLGSFAQGRGADFAGAQALNSQVQQQNYGNGMGAFGNTLGGRIQSRRIARQRSDNEMMDRNRSELLSRILQQMNYRQASFHPQTYGALAAGIGAQLVDANSYKRQMGKMEQAQQTDAQGLAKALQQYSQKSQGGPTNIPLNLVGGGTDQMMQSYKPDQQGAQQGLVQALSGNQNPMAQAALGQIMSQQLAPPPPPKIERVDVGDGILVLKDNVPVGMLPKGVTPDTGAREAGDNRRFDVGQANENQRFGVAQAGLDRRFNIGEAGENARATAANDNKQLKLTQGLRKEYEQLLPVQQLQKVLPQVQGLANAPDSAAGDMAVINAFAKIMDPETGIRKEDVDQVLRSVTPKEFVKGNVRFFVNGKGRMTPESRADLMGATMAKVGGFMDAAKRSREQYSQYATQYGVAPFDVVGDPFDDPFGGKSGATQTGGKVIDFSALPK